MTKKILCGLTVEKIFSLIEAEGYSYDQAMAVARGIYRKRITNISYITGVPKTLLNYLELVSETGFYKPVSYEISIDRTIKYLFISPQGKKY